MKKAFFLILALGVFFPCAVQAQRAEPPKPPTEMRSFDAKDGAFSAVLLILDNASMEEFKKPSDQGLRLTAKRKTKRGERVKVVIGFMGMALDYDLTARVDFDFKMTGPDGKPVGDETKNIPGLNAKIKNPMMVFHTQSEVSFEFDSSDKNGLYKIDVVIRDEVGKKTIPLHGDIELID